jgi:hypothetical protein
MKLSEAIATMSANVRGLALYVPDIPSSDYGFATADGVEVEGEEDYLGTEKVTPKKKNPAGGVVRRHIPAGYNADVRDDKGKPVKFNYKDNDLTKYWFK